MSATSVLVTGGAGFIGSHLTELLVKKKYAVTVADNLSRGFFDNIYHLRNSIRFLNVDLRKEQDAIEATKNQHVVFNLAALNTGIDYDRGKTQQMFEENMLLQMMPLRAAAIHGVKTFIQVSTASIYARAIMERNSPIKETDDREDPEPTKLGYALAKRMGEKLAFWYAENSPMRTVVARFINAYGPRDYHEVSEHFIPAIIRKFHTAKTEIEVFGSGRQRRSFVHVEDAVRALVLLAQKGRSGQAYNIDPQDEHSVKDVVRSIQKIMNKDHISVRFNTSLPEGSTRRILDNTKISALGWKPKHRLTEALPQVIDDATRRLLHKGSAKKSPRKRT